MVKLSYMDKESFYKHLKEKAAQRQELEKKDLDKAIQKAEELIAQRRLESGPEVKDPETMSEKVKEVKEVVEPEAEKEVKNDKPEVKQLDWMKKWEEENDK